MERNHYWVVESTMIPNYDSKIFDLKSIGVVATRREAREKASSLNQTDSGYRFKGSYRKVNKKEAREIAKKTQWGLLPQDITQRMSPSQPGDFFICRGEVYQQFDVYP